jgi:hypothetical protein
MARLFWIGFYCFAVVVLGGCALIAIVSLAVWRIPPREAFGVFLPFNLMMGWMMWLAFGMLRQEIARGKTSN